MLHVSVFLRFSIKCTLQAATLIESLEIFDVEKLHLLDEIEKCRFGLQLAGPEGAVEAHQVVEFCNEGDFPVRGLSVRRPRIV
jgi:hypothetical protein